MTNPKSPWQQSRRLKGEGYTPNQYEKDAMYDRMTKLEIANDDTRVLVKHGKSIIATLFCQGYRYSECGINLFDKKHAA